MIWTILIFLLTISLLVFVHEFGHFIAARLCGVTVERFSIGFGKILFSFKSKTGTEYSFACILLGGFVKMLDDKHASACLTKKNKSFNSKNFYQKSLIIICGPLFNFILAIVIFFVIFQIGVVTYPLKLESTKINTLASSINFSKQAELKTISGHQLESWDDVNNALINALGNNNVKITYQNENNELIDVTIDIKDWSFDLDKISAIESFGFIPLKSQIKPIVREIKKGSAAESAGIKQGDEILAYNNIVYNNWTEFSNYVAAGNTLILKIKRKDNILNIKVSPSLYENEQGKMVGMLGIFPTSDAIIKQYGIVASLSRSFSQLKKTIKNITNSLYKIVTGVISIKNLSGPISIAKGASVTASYGIMPYLYFLAYISISLGVFNLFPLPVLDGGRLLLLVIEKLKGSPLSEQNQNLFFKLGYLVLLLVMMIAIINDIIKLNL